MYQSGQIQSIPPERRSHHNAKMPECQNAQLKTPNPINPIQSNHTIYLCFIHIIP
ncbi:hypothetical protein BDW59DRAFT_137717 [Aspergillus cavernicola]|uniref:Uncharacterized protein n=1 Tax=Aspergillus cavernicola TaxID=176166 RepID=A0ABR4J2Z3_9EURO